MLPRRGDQGTEEGGREEEREGCGGGGGERMSSNQWHNPPSLPISLCPSAQQSLIGRFCLNRFKKRSNGSYKGILIIS